MKLSNRRVKDIQLSGWCVCPITDQSVRIDIYAQHVFVCKSGTVRIAAQSKTSLQRVPNAKVKVNCQ